MQDGLVHCDHHLMELYISCPCHDDMAENIAHLVLNNNHSVTNKLKSQIQLH